MEQLFSKWENINVAVNQTIKNLVFNINWQEKFICYVMNSYLKEFDINFLKKLLVYYYIGLL